MKSVLIKEKIKCFHCGNEYLHDCIRSGAKAFCCEGCRAVYELLQEITCAIIMTLKNHQVLKSGIRQRNIMIPGQ
jgi:hypothetical protein